ncbi:MAG: response regulator [Planctomycetes bacterium]|nr:response regulator [Planctomycetota bacterium]
MNLHDPIDAASPRRTRIGMRQRTALAFSFVLAAVSIVLVARGYLVDARILRDSARARAEQLARIVAATCSRSLTSMETAEVDRTLRAAFQDDVASIRIFDPNGRVFASEGKPITTPGASPRPADELLVVDQDIDFGGRVLGSVRVELSTRNVETHIAAMQLEHLVFAAMLAIGSFMLMSRLIGRLLRPLVDLANATRALAGGSFDVRVPIERDDEIGQLACSFNDMAEALRTTVVSREDLVRVNEQLETARQAAIASDAAKSEFLANMSHEIRTPMTAILGYAEVLLEHARTPELGDAARTIHANGRHLLAILDDILDLSKIEAGRMTVETIRCSPAQIAREVVDLMRVRAQAKNLDLRVVWRPPLPEVMATDPTRLRQVLVNLVGNAVKFTETGTVRLVVGMARDGSANHVEFDVIDTGIGMNAEQQVRIFRPFAQGDERTTRRFGGTGLGLAISRRLVELLGGTIRVHSEPGFGSRFVVSVPTGPLVGVRLLTDPDAESATATNAAEEPHGPTRPLARRRVLLAEDGPDNQRLISFLLRKLGADVTLAENGRVAHERALDAQRSEKPFDLVLMDMHMPEMDGYTTTRQLRHDGFVGAIVALTANAMEGDEARCLAAGCDGYATKPIQRAELVQTMLSSMAARAAT